LEAILRTHPDVKEVAVIGIPGADGGELLRGYFETRNPKLKATELHAYLYDRVAVDKCLDGGIEFVDTIPKAQTGKILKWELKKLSNESQLIMKNGSDSNMNKI